MNRTTIMDAINKAYLDLEVNLTDLRAIRTLGQSVWSLQYQNANDRMFAMFLALWCEDVMRNFGNTDHNGTEEDRTVFGIEIVGALKEIFFLSYTPPTTGEYPYAMQRLADVYIGAIVRSNERATCCL